MATLITSGLKSVREDLGDVITDISPEKYVFTTSIGKAKASNRYHENLTDTLAAANPMNAAHEGADAGVANNIGPERVGNHTQIFTKNVAVADTVSAVNTAGTNDELTRQVIKAGKELKRDIEAALVSANSTIVSGGAPRLLGGAEAWIKTNAFHGVGGSTAGFAADNVGAVVDGTARPITEEMFNEMIQEIWAAGGDPSLVIAPGLLKQAISKFSGNGTKFQNADAKEIFAGVDYYVSDFGRHKIIPHHFMRQTTVIAFDKTLWALATLRGIKKNELAKTGDSTKYQLVTEVTLESRNEAGNGKLADVTA
jgi:hypothetical protein